MPYPAGANCLLVGEREHLRRCVPPFCGVDSMQSGKHQVARFRGFKRDFNRFAVAHSATRITFGALSQCRAQSERKGWRVAVQFALVDRRFFVAMQKFMDFDGQYVMAFS